MSAAERRSDNRGEWGIDERFASLDAMASEARLLADRTLSVDTGDEAADLQTDTMNCREALVGIATEALALANDLDTRKIVIADRPTESPIH
jgi:hypothetical protein